MRKILGVALVAVALATGCCRTVYRGEDFGPTVSMNRPKAGETVVSHFSAKCWNHYFLFFLVPTSKPDLKSLIEPNVPAGHEVRNLCIGHKASFTNVLLWLLVGGIYNPMTTTITGDVVKVGPPPAEAARP